MKRGLVIACALLIFVVVNVSAQEFLPVDNGLTTYHTAPRYRESESHPLRVLAYIGHPIGWALREGIFRPLSYFASSTEDTRSVMGYREPFDFREPECFSADTSVPDCRTISPFNYGQEEVSEEPIASMAGDGMSAGAKEIYFPDVNFDYGKKSLSTLGEGQVRRLAELLKASPDSVKVVLQGNTDVRGTDAYNDKLGLDRAEQVKARLVDLGIPAERFATVTFGKTNPVLSGDEDWARAVNRRVDVRLEDMSPNVYDEGKVDEQPLVE